MHLVEALLFNRVFNVCMFNKSDMLDKGVLSFAIGSIESFHLMKAVIL